jgi:hypothetical protein
MASMPAQDLARTTAGDLPRLTPHTIAACQRFYGREPLLRDALLNWGKQVERELGGKTGM